MIILIEIAIVLALLGLGGNFLFRRKRDSERQGVIDRRVEAYMQTIRREGSNKELAAMSDLELRDLLLSGARNLRLEAERRWFLLIGGGLVAFFAAVMVATQEGMQGFGMTLLVAALVLYGLNEFMGRRMREPLIAKGVDVERLRVE
jgi:hypothetical protein